MTAAFVHCVNRRRSCSAVASWPSTTAVPLSLPTRPSGTVLAATNDLDTVLSNTDIGIGIILALLLASLASFLQNQRSQNDFVLGPTDDDDDDAITRQSLSSANATATTTTTTTFEDWKEMSRPDNYVWYKPRPRQGERNPDDDTVERVERRWVFLALVVLFAPIFSLEFFLTISRQLVCAISHDLCLPYDIVD